MNILAKLDTDEPKKRGRPSENAKSQAVDTENLKRILKIGKTEEPSDESSEEAEGDKLFHSMKQKLQKLKGKVNPKSFFEQEEELKVGNPDPNVENIRGRRENLKVNEYLKLDRVGISP